MDHACAVMVLIRVLPAGPERLKPLNLEVVVAALLVLGVGRDRHIEHCHGDGAGMNAATSFSRWYALEPVATRLVGEATQIRSSDFEDDLLRSDLSRALPEYAVLSTLPYEKALVCACQILRQQLRIGTALSGMDFDSQGFHSVFLFRSHIADLRLLFKNRSHNPVVIP